MAGVKKDFAYNLCLTLSNYVFPLLTFPYVSRVLGVKNIGVCNYIDSIIDYFVLFSALGVASYGVREIARVKDNAEKCKQVFSSLVSFNFILTLFALLVLVIAIIYVPKFNEYKYFLGVGACKLIFSAFLVDWFFQGISNFRYITLRSIVIRSCYVGAVFVFIHTPEDVNKYYILTSGIVILTAICNWNYSRNFIRFSVKSVKVKPYIVGILSFGVYRVLTSMYTNFNVFFLGTVCDTEQVGCFSTATKLYTILMGVFSAFATVMVPRICELLKTKDYKKLNCTASQTFQLVMMFSMPIIIIADFFAPLIIDIIAGAGYEGAVVSFRIVMSLLFVIAMEQILIQQFLLATNNYRYIISLSLLGAAVGVTLNILLTPSNGAIGSSMSWVASECSLLVLSSVYFHKSFPLIDIPIVMLVKYLIFSIPYIVIGYVFQDSSLSYKVFVALILSAVWFYILNVRILKCEVLKEVMAGV